VCQAVMPAQPLGLRSFTRARGTEEYEPHRLKP